MTKLAFLYPPGQNPGRVEYPPEKFSPHQEAVYQALSQAVYAYTHDRMETLRPTPGARIDMEDFEKWRAKALDAWKAESRSRGKGITKAIVKEDFPESLWIWLWQRIRAAPPVHVGSEVTGATAMGMD